MSDTFEVGASLEATNRQDAEGALKVWEDLDRYRQVVEASKPDVIVECGTFAGGSARWFRSLGPDVITVDITPVTLDPSITVLTGSSTDPTIVDQVRALVRGRRTMVVLDSDHSAAHVAAEIEAYGPMVTPGCYLVVEDGIVRWMQTHYTGSPLDAIESLLIGSPDWVRDTKVEALHPVSMYPAGWWRRA